MKYILTSTEESYWDVVAKMWGETAAGVAHWVVNVLFITAAIIGIAVVMFQIVSKAIKLNKEEDVGFGEALKTSSKEMLKYILLIVIAGVAIPILWEFLFPFLVAQGYNPIN